MYRDGYDLLRDIIVVEDWIGYGSYAQQRQGRGEEQRGAEICPLGRR